jgi:hypothetical protein
MAMRGSQPQCSITSRDNLMHILFLFAPFLLLIVVIRLITLPLRMARRYGGYYGNRYGWDGGYNPYRYGRRGFGGLGTILALVALDRIFGGRRF